MRNYWKRKDDNDTKSTGSHDKQKNKESSRGKAAPNVEDEQRWCSVPKTTSTTTRNATPKERQRPPQSVRGHTASAVQGASSRPSNDDEKPSLKFDDDVDEGFAFTGLLAGSGKRGFHPNSDRFTMIVDSGASDHVIDEELIPKTRESMEDYKNLKEPKIIATNANNKVFATATGTVWGYIIDLAGKRVPARISAMFVPGLGRNVFSSIKKMQSGVSTILETRKPQLQFDSSSCVVRFRPPNTQKTRAYTVIVRAIAPPSDRFLNDS